MWGKFRARIIGLSCGLDGAVGHVKFISRQNFGRVRISRSFHAIPRSNHFVDHGERSLDSNPYQTT